MAIKPQVERDESYKRVLGIDSSSTGIGWTLLDDIVMIDQGKIDLSKVKEHSDKLAVIYQRMHTLLEETSPDFIFIEKSIFVKNPATARVLSYVVGSIISVSAGQEYKIRDVEPATWKAWMGYKNLSGKFVAQVKEVLGSGPGTKFCNTLRKSQTWRVIQHNFPDQATGSIAHEDNDVADSWGIALWGANQVYKPIELQISKDISLDMEELARLGLSL